VAVFNLLALVWSATEFEFQVIRTIGANDKGLCSFGLGLKIAPTHAASLCRLPTISGRRKRRALGRSQSC
jgi:hypothetical protein